MLFLNKRWVEANRAEAERFAAEQDLFDIGNHGTRHTPLSVTGRSQYKEPGTKDVGEVYDEVMGNHLHLTELMGRPPRYFRTGTAWYDDLALEIFRACGEVPIDFDTNGDAGTTYTAGQTAQETARAKPGSIIIGHFNQPRHATFEGMKVALPKMRAAGVEFARLSDCGI
ncbi:polysaccharide deacetylase family protein [Mariniluteicoccus endophyticus]